MKDQWQPIETAPKDADYVIGFMKHYGVFQTWWSPRRKAWFYCDFGDACNWEPTHWMPLPPPPEEIE